jgi:hypothetical protein
MLTFIKRKPYEKIQTAICDDKPFCMPDKTIA